MLKESLLITVAKNQRSSQLGNEVLILNLKSEEYFGLEWVGAAIWQLISQPRTIQEIRAIILSQYQVEPQQFERDLITFINQLRANGLILLITDESIISRMLYVVTLFNRWIGQSYSRISKNIKQHTPQIPRFFTKLPYQTPVLRNWGSNKGFWYI
ncbi:MAG: PqqD family protein [Microcoleaceae cyanobacterium]